ncbi:MAG: tetratricopeptide repeat protein [Pseudomonadota bacterium]|nr:tetratricopeptide repeat protein [Pseudomonadota bacterium]
MGIALDIHDTLELVVRLEGIVPHPALPRRLVPLFRDLARPDTRDLPFEIEDLIWAIWTDHHDQQLSERMQAAIAAIAGRKPDIALPLLDALVADAPDWAEAWNKRATLHYICDRDRESIADIRETLQREPRHFGALAGFGQICLRNGDQAAAMLAFEAALRINPHMAPVKAMLSDVTGERQRPN